MSDQSIICAESPIPLVVQPWGMISPLTVCCQAAATGSGGGICCKACWEYVDASFGDCWTLEETRGWLTYYQLLVDYAGSDPAHAYEIVEYAKEKAAAKVVAK